MKYTQESFIQKATEVWGGLYDYSQTVYTGCRNVVVVICAEHGEFKIQPYLHIQKKGCRRCGHASAAEKRRAQYADVINKFKSVHGDTYNYSEVKYKKSNVKVEIVCKIHGSFFQQPDSHMQGHGCPKCKATSASAKNSMSVNEFISRASKVHANAFLYDRSKFVNTTTKMEIVCPVHGVFLQTPQAHLRGQKCPKCALLARSSPHKQYAAINVLDKFKEIHGDSYDYSKFVYVNSKTNSIIICKKHGEFLQPPGTHKAGHGCPKCVNKISKGEDDLTQFIKSLGFSIRRSRRDIIPPYEIDVFIPEKNIAIEFNGVFWHSDTIKSTTYHRNKSLACAEKDIRLIHILEDEWKTRRYQIEKMLRHALGVSIDEKVDARKCVVEQIPHKEAREFVHDNHIQGCTKAGSLNLGLRYERELVAVMMFSKGATLRGKARTSVEEAPWELSRYATNKSVRGGASKLLKAARRYINGPIVSFSQNDWYGDSGMYKTLGFQEIGKTPPDYRVWHPKTGVLPKSRWQRRNIPKMLALIGSDIQFDPKTDARTEYAIEDAVNALRIWDSGKTKWILP